MVLSRRSLLLAASSVPAFWTSASASKPDFWNQKPPSAWSAEEIGTLLTRSPWARRVTAEYLPGQQFGCSGGGRWSETPPLAPSGGPIGGIAGVPPFPGSGTHDRQPRRVKSPYMATVRWESARPSLEASKARIPEAMDKHYVLCVTGLSTKGERDCQASTGGDDLNNLKGFTTLRGKDNDVIHADVIHRHPATPSTFLFGFSRSSLPLSEDAKQVEFSTQLDRFVVSAKFALKEMRYQSALAL